MIGRLIINDLRCGMAEFIGFFEIWGWGAYPGGGYVPARILVESDSSLRERGMIYTRFIYAKDRTTLGSSPVTWRNDHEPGYQLEISIF
jgi:hypothetical protein